MVRSVTFEQAAAVCNQLRRRFAAGELPEEEFEAQVAALRLQTPDGSWWQINPTDLTWLWWDGGKWTSPLEAYCHLGCRSELSFDGADETYKQARRALARGELPREDFLQRVTGLRVQFHDGTWWEMRPEDGEWFCWEAGAWQSLRAVTERIAQGPQVVPTHQEMIPIQLEGVLGDVALAVSVLCATCRNWTEGLCCQAFPEGIPRPIVEGRWDHRQPYPGDRHVRYRCIHAPAETPEGQEEGQ